MIALLLAAQNDMRWTTSPRLSLELALVRACLPDTDPTPAGMAARLERLERLANLAPGSTVPAASAVEPAAPTTPADDVVVVESAPPPEPTAAKAKEPAKEEDEAATSGEPASGAAEEPAPAAEAPTAAGGDGTQMPVPHAADAGNVDVSMLRRSWKALLDHLGEMRPPQPVLRAFLESATPASYDGDVLELAFPPDKRFGVQKVMDRQDVLRQAIADLFGVTPTITCVVRESRDPAGGPASVEVVEEDEVPDDAEALRRVQEMFGAQPIEGASE